MILWFCDLVDVVLTTLISPFTLSLILPARSQPGYFLPESQDLLYVMLKLLKFMVITWSKKVMMHISRSVLSTWTHLWNFHLPSCPHEKLLPKNCWWPTYCKFSIQGTKSTCNPTFQSVLNSFRPKEATFNFIQLMYNEQVAKLKSSCVTNIYKNSDTLMLEMLLRISIAARSASRFSYVKHSNVFWGEVTWRDLLTWSWVTWVWNVSNMCRKEVWTGVPAVY